MRFIFLFVGLIFGAGALFCFIFPIAHAQADNASILMFPGFFLALFAWLSFYIFRAIGGACEERKRFKRLSESEQSAYAEHALADMKERTRIKIDQDRKKAGEFLTSSTKRRKLRQSIAQDNFLLDIVEDIETASKNKKDEI